MVRSLEINAALLSKAAFRGSRLVWDYFYIDYGKKFGKIIGKISIRHYVSGLIAEQIPKLHRKSLAPLGGSSLWDGIISFCPLFGFLRFAFNPMLLGSGEVESEVSYSNSPSFFLCISLEHLNYHYLLPAGFFIESLNYICSR